MGKIPCRFPVAPREVDIPVMDETDNPPVKMANRRKKNASNF
jgi:hypothetical protein